MFMYQLLYNSSEGGEGTSGFMQMMAILVPGVVQENSTIVPSIGIRSYMERGGSETDILN